MKPLIAWDRSALELTNAEMHAANIAQPVKIVWREEGFTLEEIGERISVKSTDVF